MPALLHRHSDVTYTLLRFLAGALYAFHGAQKLFDFPGGQVEASLKRAPALDDVKVASVNKGVVLLSGKTDGLGHTLQAIEAAYKVPGVRRVASEIEPSDKGDK